MKKRIRIALFAICVVIEMNFLLIGCFCYAVDHRKTIWDTSVSLDGKYELTLIEIGEPVWPFGPASGRLTLKEGDNQINQADFELKNDGCSISSNCWTVAWMTDYVEVVLSGYEQFDEQILLYFDGSTQRQTLDNEAESTASQVETGALDIQVMENRKNELVFTISTSDYVESYNSYYKIVAVCYPRYPSGSVLPTILQSIPNTKQNVTPSPRMSIYIHCLRSRYMYRQMMTTYSKSPLILTSIALRNLGSSNTRRCVITR